MREFKIEFRILVSDVKWEEAPVPMNHFGCSDWPLIFNASSCCRRGGWGGGNGVDQEFATKQKWVEHMLSEPEQQVGHKGAGVAGRGKI